MVHWCSLLEKAVRKHGFHQRLQFLKTASRHVMFSDGFIIFIPDWCTIRMLLTKPLDFKHVHILTRHRWFFSSSQGDHHPFRLTCSTEKVMRSNHKWVDLPWFTKQCWQELWKVHQNGDLTKKKYGIITENLGKRLPEMEAAYHSVTSISLGKWWLKPWDFYS